jgi:uncharacterized protein
MHRELPLLPDMAQQRRLAKDLLKAWRAADPAAYDRFREHHPALIHASAEGIAAYRVVLADAQLVIAREYGFESWPKLKLEIELRSAVEYIKRGDTARLRLLLQQNPSLARERVRYPDGMGRTLLHVATDWPGGYPNLLETIAVLVQAGADVNAAFAGVQHSETPLHWAASGDDVEVLDALLDAGANIEASGSVISGGTPLADAVAFGNWRVARRLIERGARTMLWQAAALGLMDRVENYFSSDPKPLANDVTNALWCACHGGQRSTAEYLLKQGADLNWVGHDKLTPLDAARRSHATELIEWLMSNGAKSAGELAP